MYRLAAHHQTQAQEIEASVAAVEATIHNREAILNRVAILSKEAIHNKAMVATLSRVGTEDILNSRTVNSSNQYTSNSSHNNPVAVEEWAVAVLGKFLCIRGRLVLTGI